MNIICILMYIILLGCNVYIVVVGLQYQNKICIIYMLYICIYTGKKTYINNSGYDNGDLNGIGYHRTNQQCMVFGC